MIKIVMFFLNFALQLMLDACSQFSFCHNQLPRNFGSNDLQSLLLLFGTLLIGKKIMCNLLFKQLNY